MKWSWLPWLIAPVLLAVYVHRETQTRVPAPDALLLEQPNPLPRIDAVAVIADAHGAFLYEPDPVAVVVGYDGDNVDVASIQCSVTDSVSGAVKGDTFTISYTVPR